MVPRSRLYYSTLPLHCVGFSHILDSLSESQKGGMQETLLSIESLRDTSLNLRRSTKSASRKNTAFGETASMRLWRNTSSVASLNTALPKRIVRSAAMICSFPFPVKADVSARAVKKSEPSGGPNGLQRRSYLQLITGNLSSPSPKYCAVTLSAIADSSDIWPNAPG